VSDEEENDTPSGRKIAGTPGGKTFPLEKRRKVIVNKMCRGRPVTKLEKRSPYADFASRRSIANFRRKASSKKRCRGRSGEDKRRKSHSVGGQGWLRPTPSLAGKVVEFSCGRGKRRGGACYAGEEKKKKCLRWARKNPPSETQGGYYRKKEHGSPRSTGRTIAEKKIRDGKGERGGRAPGKECIVVFTRTTI